MIGIGGWKAIADDKKVAKALLRWPRLTIFIWALALNNKKFKI